MTQSGINWRTDVENAPKDGSKILVVGKDWGGQPQIVSWCATNEESHDLHGDELEFGWVFDYDYEQGFAYYVEEFSHWCPLNMP